MRFLDKILFGLGIGLVIAVYFVAGRREVALPPVTVATARPYEAPTLVMPSFELKEWNNPPASDWVFHVFTPPVVYFDPVERVYTVTPPDADKPITDTQQGGAEFNLELLTVSQAPYRIQLVGYVGDPANPLLNFEINGVDSALGRPGRKYDQYQFEIVSGQVKRDTVIGEGGTPVVDEYAIATIRDIETGELVDLTSKQRLLLDIVSGRFRAGPAQFDLKEGESRQVDSWTYVVQRLTIAPPAAVVQRLGETERVEPVVRLLRPGAPPQPVSLTNEPTPSP